jgi:hypothetical protein
MDVAQAADYLNAKSDRFASTIGKGPRRATKQFLDEELKRTRHL